MKFSRSKQNKGDPFVIQSGKFGQLKDFSYRLGWTEDSFTPGAGKREIVGRTFDFSKIKLIGAVILFFLFILIGRVAWLQVVKGDYYYSLAEGNRIRIERIEPKRGIIYDRNSNVLARNTANWLLYFIPIDFPKDKKVKDEIILKLSEILNSGREPMISEAGEAFFTPEYLEDILAKVKIGSLESYQPLFVLDNIPYEKAMLLYLELDNMPGVFLSNKTRREYNLYSLSLSHLLGYTGKINAQELSIFGDEYSPIDYIGKNGIEYFWENELKGENGKKYIEVDALGKEKKIISQSQATDGHNLVLSLDLPLQKKLEESLLAHLKKLNLNKASAIVMDPNSGEILAMVSFPVYNNNIFARGITAAEYNQILAQPDDPLFNRSVSGEYPSGSIIKSVMAAAGLQARIISENTSFNSVGGIKIGQWFFPDWKAGGHGATSVRKAIAESVNTFFYYLGGGYEDFVGLGVDKIVRYFKLFGLGTQTGVDLPGEASGFVPTKEWKEKVKGESWYIGDTYHMSIGQGDVLVTPLQVANYTAAFANGGKLYRPHFIKAVLSGSDRIIKTGEPEIIREDFIDNYNMQVVRQGMRQTVVSGSARSLGSLPVAVAGKTGTAQWSTKKAPHAWFTGFAPYENPKIVITVLLEEGGEGSTVAVPIVREILEWYFSNN